MVTVSFHQICITTLCLGLTCGVVACATDRWHNGSGLFGLGDDVNANLIKATTIIGVAFLAFALVFEILMIVSDTFKLSRAVRILCLVWCIISVSALLVALVVYGVKFSTGGYSVWLLTASAVFALEALFFYVVQWRCT